MIEVAEFSTKNIALKEVITDYRDSGQPHTYWGRIPPNSRGVTLYQYDRMNKLYKEGLASFQNNWATFKLRSYWKIKKTGELYNDYDLALQKNITTTDSYDWIPTKSDQQYYVNEQMAMMKLLKFMRTHKANAFMFMLFANIGSKQYLIGYWNHKNDILSRNFAQFKTVNIRGNDNVYLEASQVKENRHLTALGALSPTPYEFTETHKKLSI